MAGKQKASPADESATDSARRPSVKLTEKRPSTGEAGLVYVSDDMPGFSRLKAGKGFRYRDDKGAWLRDVDEISRIRMLAIPPAYTRVWICPHRDGHLQATGYDSRGRKQYRYHPDWQTQRNDSKFDRLQAFGSALPRIRFCMARDLKPHKNRPVSRTLVLATLVRLLDTTFARVGNDEYARENGSYGLTTLRNPHARVHSSTLQLRFRGKSGVMQDLKITDPKVAAVVRRCQQLPGQLLFQYQDEQGALHAIDSSDVNKYLAEIVKGKRARNEQKSDEEPPQASYRHEGKHFTAKDFRTWHGTVQALELTRLACSGAASKPFNANHIVQEVAQQLGNTPAVCRKSYIHPAVLALGGELAGQAGVMSRIWDRLAAGKPVRRLHAAETRLLDFLKADQRHIKKRPGPRRKAAG